MLIAIYLNWKHKVNFSFGDVMSNMFGYFLAVIMFIVLPMIYLYMVYIPRDRLYRRFKYFDTLLEDLRFWDKSSIFYRLVFLIRRVLYITLLMNPDLQKYPLIQIIFLSYIQLFSAIYLFHSKPFSDSIEMTTEMLNDITILSATELMIFYTDILSPKETSLAGWIAFVIFLIQLLINFVKIAVQTLSVICIRIKYIWCYIQRLLWKPKEVEEIKDTELVRESINIFMVQIEVDLRRDIIKSI